MNRVGTAALFAVFLLLTSASPGRGAALESTASPPDSTELAPDSTASPAKASGDSARSHPPRKTRKHNELAGSAWSIVDPGLPTDRPRRSRPPYPKGIHWPDRPLSGIGTHIPGRAEIEVESQAVSYTRSSSTEQTLHVAWTTDTTGYGSPHYVYSYGPERFLREAVQAAAQQLSIGFSRHVAIVLVSDGYRSDRVTREQASNNSVVDSWHTLNAIKLKIRPWGSDSIGWAHAFALELAGRDEYAIVGYAFSQGIPLGGRTKGCLSASVEGAHYPGRRLYADSYPQGHPPNEPTFDFEPFDVALSVEHRWTSALWSFTEWTIHRDLVLPEVSTGVVSLGAAHSLGTHFMLDAGARFGTTRQSPDVQGFLGFSLR